MAGVFGVLIFLVAAISGIFAVLVWSLWMIKPKGNTHKLWSIWQRDHIAVKNDKFIGKSTTKDTQGNVVAVFFWVGSVAIGWFRPLDLTAVEEAGMVSSQVTNTLTPPLKRNI